MDVSGAAGDNVAALPNILPFVNLGRKLASDGASSLDLSATVQVTAVANQSSWSPVLESL